MKPQPQIDLDAAGAEALQLFAQDRVASGNLKDIRSQRIARKEQLKKVLPIIWAALEAGQPVNGYTTKESWCKEYAKVEMRTVQYIIYGRKKNEANSVRVLKLKLKPGDRIEIDRWVFEVPPPFSEDSNVSIKRPWNDGNGEKHTNVTIHGLILVEDKNEKPAPKKKEEKQKTARLTLRQTYIAINAVRKQVGKDDHTIEWAQRQYDGILALNGAEKKPHYSAYRTALKNAEKTLQGRIQYKETEERMAKITHLVSEESEYTLCTRKNMRLTADVDAVECEECREAVERQKKYDELKPVHAAGNTINPEITRSVRCRNGGSRPKITSDKAKVTCTNCLTGLDQDEALSWLPDFEKTVPKGTTKREKSDLWQVYLKARQGYIYDPEKVTVNPCDSEDEAMEWYGKYLLKRLGFTESPDEPERECPHCKRTVVPNHHSIAECDRFKTEAMHPAAKALAATVDGIPTHVSACPTDEEVL